MGEENNNWLLEYKGNIRSQHGEDGIIKKCFEIIPDSDKWCVEFGAWDGKLLSNTWNLINNHAWNAILIEGDKAKALELKKYYENNVNIHPVQNYVMSLGPNSLDNILKEYSIPKYFDLLSVDIDGNDYHIFKSINNFKPKLVVIEFNPTIPIDISFIQEDNIKCYHGSSILALVELGKEKGYELVSATRNNAFFVANKYFHLFKIEDNSLCTLYPYDPTVQMRIFQLYDGTIVLEGNTNLRWAGKYKLKHRKVQLIPKILRKWKGNSDKPFLIKVFSYLHQFIFGESKLFNLK